jgi:hypothetical protein
MRSQGRTQNDSGSPWRLGLSSRLFKLRDAEKADVLRAIYDQIVVTGREIVSVRLTPWACTPRPGACAAHQGGFGALDRCWARTHLLQHLWLLCRPVGALPVQLGASTFAGQDGVGLAVDDAFPLPGVSVTIGPSIMKPTHDL